MSFKILHQFPNGLFGDCCTDTATGGDTTINLTVEFNGSEMALGNHASKHVFEAEDEIDADRLSISYEPSGYTPTVTPAQVTDTHELTAHLAGIASALSALSAGMTWKGVVATRAALNAVTGQAVGDTYIIESDSDHSNARTLNIWDGSAWIYLGEWVQAYAHPNHVGDVVSVGDGATTIQADVVTNTKLANMTTGTLKGRITTDGDPMDLTTAQVLTLLSINTDLQDITVVVDIGDPGSDTAIPSEQAVREAIDALSASIAHGNHTGDVTSVDMATTIVANAVTNTKLADMAAARIKGRQTSTGDPEDLTAAQVLSILEISTDLQNLTIVTTVGTPGIDTAVPSEKAVRDAISAGAYTHPNHSGDVVSAGDGATTIQNDVVDNAKLANMTAARIKGRITTDGDPMDLTVAQVLTLLDISTGLQGLSLVTTVGDPGVDTNIVSEQGIREALTAAVATPADHAASHIRAGTDEIDGDKLDIDWNPTNYTPATVTEADNVDHLAAHLKGIDNKLAAAIAHALDSLTIHSALSDNTNHNVSEAAHGFMVKQPADAGQFFSGLASKGWTREIMKAYFNGWYEEKMVDKGSVSGTVTVTITDGLNQKMTITGTTTLNIVSTGITHMTFILLGITMSSAHAVTWQLNGVTQTGVSIDLNDSGFAEVRIVSWDSWSTYIAQRTY